MGLWDQHIAALGALGVRFSEAELRYLETEEEGLHVLHLHPLFDPSSMDGQVWYMEDQNGEHVYMPEILRVIPWSFETRTGKGSVSMLADEMEDTYGSVTERYPSYFAQLTDGEAPETWEAQVRAEETHPYPFWTCLPITSDFEMDAAKRLVEARNEVLRRSLFGQIEFICEFEAQAEGMADVQTMWMVEKHGEEPGDDYEEHVAEALSDREDPEHYKKLLVDAFEDLVTAGYIPDPRWNYRLRELHGSSGLRLDPVEDQLAGDYLALDMWNSIRARMRFMRDRVESTGGMSALRRLISLEGTFG